MLQSIKTFVPKVTIIFKTVFIVMWLAVLSGTDALYCIYALCAVVCVFCMFNNILYNRGRPESGFICTIVVCCIFTVMVFLANYPQFTVIWYMDSLYYPTNILKNGLNSVSCLIGGFFVAYEIVVYFLYNFPKQSNSMREQSHPNRMFFFVFFSVIVIDLVYLFFDEFPGHLSADAIYQIRQGYTNWYMNDHPFWNTMYIKLVLNIGYTLFRSSNAAVALYCILQIIFVAYCFGYAMMTLYQIGIPKWLLGLVYFIYVMLPYNIVYSISMYKDISFSLAVLLMLVSFFRLFRSIGGIRKWDYTMFTAGSIIVCFSRTNGLPLLLLFTLILFHYMLKHDWKLILILLVICLLAGILCGPMLMLLDVRPSEVTEPLSLPLQQMARVVCDGCLLTDSQELLLGIIFDLENLNNVYVPWYADPIKQEVRLNDNVYFAEHLTDYAKLWFELGIEHPIEYLKAWIDQTKGYWNGGYNYFQYVEGIEVNDYGFVKASGNNVVAKLIDTYFALTRQYILFEPFHSIGLHVWIVGLCGFLNWRRKRIEAFLCIPLILIVFGLWIGTPVFAEFRYTYPLFLAVPFLVPITLYQQDEG